MANASLNIAIRNKNDEFYTQIADIERECGHYAAYFKGRTIFCNCDDPDTSNFWRYFHINFKILGLKKLVSTHFVYQDMYHPGDTYRMEYTGGNDADFTDGKKTILEENGDFRSAECIDILKSADIVVTNPPFSLFREYVAQLMEYDKKFLIIGSKNAVTYKEIFKLIKENRLWLGYGFAAGNAYFGIAPEAAPNYAPGVYDPKTGLVKFRNVGWYTNLDVETRHEEMFLFKKYTPEAYPKYDNYDAIEVSKLADIPADFAGVMGVPVTFLDQYNPNQFEILGCNRGVDQDPNGVYGRGSMLKGKETFKRLFIRRRA